MRASAVVVPLAAAVVAAVVLPAAGAVAKGDDKAPEIVRVSAPSSVGMSPSGAVFHVDVRVTDNIEVSRVVVGVVDASGKVGQGFAAKLVDGMGWDGTYRAKVVMPASVPLGGWKVRAYAEDNASNTSGGVNEVRDTFTLKPATRIKLNAGPEPVVKGAVLTVKGSLQRADKDAWTPYAGRTLAIQYRKTGKSWVTVANVVTRANGAYSYTTKARSAAKWRAVYAGDGAHTKATSKTDSIALA